MQLNKEKVREEKQWFPDLQLGLSQVGDGNTETQEINTKLSLS